MKNKNPFIVNRFRIAFLLFILASIKGFYHLPRSIFDADQEYFAFSGKSILQGDLTLIGQQTGVGELYHAPLFNYLVAGLLGIFNGNPLVINGLGSFFTAITTPAIFLLGSQITSAPAALISALLVLFGDPFINTEVLTPNLIPLTLITLLYLWVLTRNWKKRFRSLVLGGLVGLSFHFHILGSMLILPLFTMSWTWIPSFLLFASPLILFDLRNKFLITQHALNFFNSTPGMTTPLQFRFDTYITSLTDLIDFQTNPLISKLLVAVVILAGITNDKLNRWIKITLIIPLIFFLWYSKHLTPYYSIVAWMPFILIVGFLLSFWWRKGKILRLAVIAYLCLFAYFNLLSWFKWNPGKGINQKIAALEYIKQHAGQRPFYLSKTIEKSSNFGFDYLIDYLKLKPTNNPNDPNYTLVVPAYWQDIKPDVQFGAIGVMLPKENKVTM